ncbi:hypothetical protein ACE3MQ_05855 [Paenibacillus lentus]|uniref:hypothetical protein n=1 Tax=Paenibacillus lentus TaxID=1338368 RepID=UPI00365A8A19
MNNKQKKSNLLIVLQLLLGIGAVFGGAALIIDPSGELIGMPLLLLENSFFNNYLIPGLLLFTALGVIPITIASGLLIRWNWKLAEKLNVFRDKHWSWTFSLYSGFQLIIWITIQVYIIDAFSIIHLIYITLGLLIQIVTLLPNVQEKYKR